jgi:ABC-type multidrug transport system fused ATPase/permease subunit
MNEKQRSVVNYFLRPHKAALAGLCVLSLAAALVETLAVFTMLPLFSSLLGTAGSTTRGVTQVLDMLVAATPTTDPLAGLCVVLLALTLLRSTLSLSNEHLIARVGGRVLYEAKHRVLTAYGQAPYRYFLDTPQGEMVYTLNISPVKLSIVVMKLPQMLVEGLRLGAVTILLLCINARIALVLMVLGLLLDRAMAYLSRRVSYNYGRGRADAQTEQTILMTEFINGIKQISIFGVKEHWQNRFAQANGAFRDLYVKDATLLALPKNLVETSGFFLLGGSILILHTWFPGTMASTLPVLATFAAAALKLLPSLSLLARARMEILGALPDIERIHAILHAEFPAPRAGGKKFSGLEDAVHFTNVNFQYRGSERILEDFSLKIPKGQTLSIVGDSGSGKTTLINLLVGFYQPDSGSINADTTPLSELDLSTWRASIGVVTQDGFVSHTSVYDNIVFGRSGFSREQVEAAARTAHADGFIRALPQGYDTIVGEKGMKLSGGQQQRIAIARAVLSDPEILIFDEATSALDAVSEDAVQRAIQDVSRGKTVIQITHRLAAVEASDRIVVLRQGRLVESGTHTELLSLKGRYAEFHQRRRALQETESAD